MFSASLQRASHITLSEQAKAALALAGEFEESILRCGLRAGMVFGPEKKLAQRYSSSPGTVRQALRILEARELGRMRRGSNGGLIVRIPSERMTARMMAIYLTALHVTGAQISDAHDRLLDCMKASLPTALLRADHLFRHLRELYDEDIEDRHRKGETQSNRALRIASRIIRDNRISAPSEGTTQCTKIGSVEALCDRYSAGKPVMVQAMRVLEDLELISAERGRTGGFRLRQPSPGAIVRTTYAHLVARRVAVEEAAEIIWAINQACAARAASLSSPQDRQQIAILRDQIDLSSLRSGDISSQIELFRHIADLAADPVLHMLARCLFYYEVHSRPVTNSPQPFPDAVPFCTATCTIADMIIAGDPKGAADAVRACSQLASASFTSH